jgi:hypothetical protein
MKLTKCSNALALTQEKENSADSKDIENGSTGNAGQAVQARGTVQQEEGTSVGKEKFKSATRRCTPT